MNLEERQNELEREIDLIHKDIQNGYLEHFIKVFKDIKNVKMQMNSRSVAFSRFHPKYSYDREICTIYMDSPLMSESDKHWEDVYLNYYTTTCDNEWEMDRVITLGEIAQALKGNKEKILKGINDVYDSYKPKNDKLIKEIRNVSKQIIEKKEKEQKRKFDALLEQCYKGIEVDEKWINLNSLENILIGWFKIEAMNKGGKTYHIKYKYPKHHYPSENVYECGRVKRKYVEEFLKKLI